MDIQTTITILNSLALLCGILIGYGLHYIMITKIGDIMIKTFRHEHDEIMIRDKDINNFSIENEVFATQTNTTEQEIITTIFYKSKSK